MMMEEFGIPELDPSLPEPDFFDAVDIGGNILTASSPTHIGNVLDMNLPPPENILDNFDIGLNGLGEVSGEAVQIKYDDETCDYDEFLIGVNKETVTLNKDSGDSEIQQNGIPLAEVGETSPGDSQSDFKAKAGTSSAVVRLSLPTVPKLNIVDSKRHITSAKVPSRTSSQSSSVSSQDTDVITLNSSKTSSNRSSKRKLDLDEDYRVDESDENEEDENTILEKSRVTRTGRKTRKVARYGFGKEDGQSNSDNDEDDDDLIQENKRTRSNPKRSSRSLNSFKRLKQDEAEISDSGSSIMECLESDLFVPIIAKRVTSRHSIDSNGTIHFTDGFGQHTEIRNCHVTIQRLTSDEISNMKEELAAEAARRSILLEVCIDNFMSAQEAVKGGAKRIELCSSLAEGGLTPSIGFLQLVKDRFPQVPVYAMIRPRGGDFLYTDDEIEIMSRDIDLLKANGADGFVFGVLTEESEVDEMACKKLLDLAYPSECTFHRAFDKVHDPFKALETVIGLGFKRILTSGLCDTAHRGIPTLKRLVQEAKDRIIILAGAGVNEKNVFDIVRKTGVKEVHGSASTAVASLVNCAPSSSSIAKKGKKGKSTRGRPKKSEVKMGATDDSIIKVTDSSLVAQIIRNGSKRHN